MINHCTSGDDIQIEGESDSLAADIMAHLRCKSAMSPLDPAAYVDLPSPHDLRHLDWPVAAI